MKLWLIIPLMLASTICFATAQQTIDNATHTLHDANQLFKSGHTMAAAKKDLEVFKTKGLPDEIYASAYLLMGNISLSLGDLQVSEVSYRRILKLKKASDHDKQVARSGILLIHDLKQDAEQLKPPLIDYK